MRDGGIQRREWTWRTVAIVAVLTLAWASVPFILFFGLYLWSLDTEYAPAYSERAFREMPLEVSAEEVLARLGEPFEKSKVWIPEWLYYGDDGEAFLINGEGTVLAAQSVSPALRDLVYAKHPKLEELPGERGPLTGKEPLYNHEVWYYSRSPSNGNYTMCTVWVNLDTGTVVKKTKRFYFD